MGGRSAAKGGGGCFSLGDLLTHEELDGKIVACHVYMSKDPLGRSGEPYLGRPVTHQCHLCGECGAVRGREVPASSQSNQVLEEASH